MISTGTGHNNWPVSGIWLDGFCCSTITGVFAVFVKTTVFPSELELTVYPLGTVVSTTFHIYFDDKSFHVYD